MGMKGIVASTAGLSVLLSEGIGDTIRVSLTPEPGAGRELEVEVAQQVLQSLGLRSFMPQVSACPGCGRTTSVFFQEMARDITAHLRERMPGWRELHPGVEDLRVAVMGCVVNGPGESKHADIGISLPGTFEEPVAPVFVDGRLLRDVSRGGHRGPFHRAAGRVRRAALPGPGRRSGRRPGPARARRIAARAERGATPGARAHRAGARPQRPRVTSPARGGLPACGILAPIFDRAAP